MHNEYNRAMTRLGLTQLTYTPYYYYYYAAFNAPCVGHKDVKSQVIQYVKIYEQHVGEIHNPVVRPVIGL